jgi:hypothetical protein
MQPQHGDCVEFNPAKNLLQKNQNQPILLAASADRTIATKLSTLWGNTNKG